MIRRRYPKELRQSTTPIEVNCQNVKLCTLSSTSTEMAMLDDDERDELLLSCRYGDLVDVKAAVDKHGQAILASTRDENQNTVLHMVCANGHLGA